MSGMQRTVRNVLAMTSLVLALAFIVSGCGKEEPATQPSAPTPTMRAGDGMMGNMDANEMAANVGAADLAGIEQKTCPVMEGNPINPDIYVEYQGKKVYFCCNICREKFLADPEKYVAKLPQFQQ